jgi:DNA invertase Pin-like site-specific DNA recombinase
MKAVGYIRVSSEMQVKNGHSLDMQRQLIIDYVHSKGWGLADLFCETARTGRLTDRPALKMMLARANRGEFDVIVVTSLDRFYRSLMRLLIALDQLHRWNVAFVSITENIDFTTPWGKVTLAVLGSLGEIYCDKLSVETKRGKQGRALKGLWNGTIPFGYCNGLCSMCTDVNGLNYCPQYGQPNRGDGKTLIFHPIESVGVRLSFDWYRTEKYSDGMVAEKLNGYVVALPDGTTRHFRTKRLLARGGPQPFTRDSVRELLMRVFYTGRVPYFGTTTRGAKLKRRHPAVLHRGQHPALIEIDTFDRCQEIRGRRSRPSRVASNKSQSSFPLTGLLVCGECGGHMIGAHCHGERRYLCNARIQHRVRCAQPSVSAESIEATIVGLLSNLKWSDDWREQWKQSLESAWDKVPFLSDDTRRWWVREKQCSTSASFEKENLTTLTPEQSARQRSFEIEQLIETMEPLSAFRAHWEIALGARDALQQKRLLRLAISRVVVRGDHTEKVEPTGAFAHLLQNTHIVCNVSQFEGAEARLMAQLISRSAT